MSPILSLRWVYSRGVTHILNVAYGVPNTFPEVGMYSRGVTHILNVAYGVPNTLWVCIDMVSHTYLMWLMVSPTLSLRWVCIDISLVPGPSSPSALLIINFGGRKKE